MARHTYSSKWFTVSVDDHGTIKSALGKAGAFGNPKASPIGQALMRGCKAGAELYAERLREAVSTWEHKPDLSISGGSRSMTMLGSTVSYTVNGAAPSKDNPYPWIDEGTRGPYQIRAKNAPFLAFQSGYMPKTNPGTLTAQAGGSYGGMVFAKEVTHPGIKARNISSGVAKLVETKIQDHTERLVVDALKEWER